MIPPGPTPTLSRPRERCWVVVVAVLSSLAVFWPLPLHLTDGLVTSPTGEGPQHVWRWWVAGQIDWPWGGHFDGVNHPEGLWVHVVDPLHALIAGALGWWWGGPAGGHAVVQVLGIVVSALAGHLLAEEAGADRAGRILGTAAGLAIPTVVGAGLDGITEGLGLGWVGLQFGLLLRLIRCRRRADVGWLALALGCTAWSGPYNLVFAALIDGVVAGAALRRTRLPLLAGGLGLILASPIIWAALRQDDASPGGAGRAMMERPNVVDAWRGAWREGADLLDLCLPSWVTGDAALAPTTGYLGIMWLCLVAAGTVRAARWGQLRSIVPWLAGGGLFAVLALGPFLVVHGSLVEAGAVELWAPAAFLESVPVLGRLSRWYRAAAVAVLLWVPVAAVAVRGRSMATAFVIGLVVVLDARLGSPVPFPGAVVPVVEVEGQSWSGPVAELPAIHPIGMPGVTAGRNLLLQTIHGMPSSATIDARAGAATDHIGLKVLENVVRTDAPDRRARIESARRQLVRSGFRNLALYPSMLPEGAVDRLATVLGPATEVAPGMWLIPLER